jgi:hypothetical protein
MSLCEHAFGPYVKATNSENFMFKNTWPSIYWVLRSDSTCCQEIELSLSIPSRHSKSSSSVAMRAPLAGARPFDRLRAVLTRSQTPR